MAASLPFITCFFVYYLKNCIKFLTMKKRLNFIVLNAAILLALGISFQSFSQTPCSADLHAVFGNSSTDKPVVLNRLGTSPQFGEIPKHTAQAAYNHLKTVHKKNSHDSRSEIDTYLRALGYTGLLDSEFGPSKITPEFLPKGKIGWMGAYARGHKYKWSVLGREFETFRIASKDGSCHAYIMKKCGNAFYDPAPREAAAAEAAAAALAFNSKPKVTCAAQTINFLGKGKIQAGDVLNTTKNLPVVASYNGKSLCLGDFTVPVRLTYEMTASGEVNYSKTVQICDYGTGVPATSSINLPLLLNYNLGGSDVTIGDDGKMTMVINSKQYKALKKVYKVCPADAALAPQNKTLAGTKVNTASESTPASAVVAGNGQNCVKQTLSIVGTAATEDVSSKSSTNEVTIIGMYKKAGKLQKGETANKYLCLGSYNVPAKSSLQYALKGNSNLSHIIEVCDNGNVNPNESLNATMKLTNSFTKQETMIGDYGRIYRTLTKSEYKKLGKVFKRCCSDGSSKSKCY
jgi:hypothetical protein